jgi:two-component system, NarL family, nitrate/nitrite response regulator NarL
MAADRPSPKDAWLETPEGRMHRVERTCLLGRLGQCDVVLADEGVSRQHARIATLAKAGHSIVDLGSTNGTYVNGLRITEATLLRDQDTIGLGSCRLKFRTSKAVSELATETAMPGTAVERRRVLIAADESLIGEGLLRMIENRADLQVAGHAAEPRRALQMHARLRPDVMLLDASTDGIGALSLLTDLLAADPEARIAAVLSRPDPDFIGRVLRHGALACVLRSDPPDELIRALHSAAAGSVYLSRRVASVSVRHLAGSKEGGRRGGPEGLTDRELEIFHLVGGAKANREIAAALGMSVKTVETHKENIKIKLGVASASELSERAKAWLAGSGVSPNSEAPQ